MLFVRSTGLTPEEFAARYRIPLGTLRDWEQGRSPPDRPARAYLTVIAHDPKGCGARRRADQRLRKTARSQHRSYSICFFAVVLS